MTWKPRSKRFQRVQALQATVECAVDARVAADEALGVTTSRRTRQRVAALCRCRRCHPPTTDECPAVTEIQSEDAIRASLQRKRKILSDCFYCGADVTASGARILDAMTPARLGGANDPRNRVPACRRCAAIKQAKTSEEYRVILAKTRGTPTVFHGESGARPRCPRYPHDGEFAFRAAGRRGTHADFPCVRGPELVRILGWTDATTDARGSRIETAFTPEFLARMIVKQALVPPFPCATAPEITEVAPLPSPLRRRGRNVLPRRFVRH